MFLQEEEVLAIHRDQIARYGGTLGLRDEGLLHSALSQPAASFAGQWLHQDLYEMAAAYLFSLVMNHPFVDGNKRVGTMAALNFLYLNDIEVDADIDEFERLVIAVASGAMAKIGVAAFLRQRGRPLPDPDLTP